MKIHKNRYKETLVSALLLAGLTATVFLIFSGRMGIGYSSGRSDRQTPAGYSLPEGWQLTGAWRVFPEGQMYEIINGREPLFLQYGVHQLEFAEVAFEDQIFDVYVYRMKTPDGALGIYLAHTPREFTELDFAARADYSGGQTRILEDVYYLEIVSMDLDADESSAIRLAQHFADQLKTETAGHVGQISELLPDEGQIRGTLSFNNEQAHGLQSLSDTYSASYERDDRSFDYLIRNLDADRVEQILQAIRDEVELFGGAIAEDSPGRLAGEILGRRFAFEKVSGTDIVCGIYGDLPPEKSRSELQTFVIHIQGMIGGER